MCVLSTELNSCSWVMWRNYKQMYSIEVKYKVLEMELAYYWIDVRCWIHVLHWPDVQGIHAMYLIQQMRYHDLKDQILNRCTALPYLTHVLYWSDVLYWTNVLLEECTSSKCRTGCWTNVLHWTSVLHWIDLLYRIIILHWINVLYEIKVLQ